MAPATPEPAPRPATAEEPSDAGVLRSAIDRAAYPAKEPRSFALHAPLELLARAALLPHVAPAARALAREQVAACGRHYAATTAPLPGVPERAPEGAGLPDLLAGIEAGDLPGTAALARELARALPMDRLAAALAPATVDTLAAAGHAPIFFQRAARLDAARAADARALLAALAPELARTPQLRIRWQPAPRDAGDTEAVCDAVERSLAATTASDAGGVGSLSGRVHATETAGVPERALGDALALDWARPAVAERLTRLACRVAVRSMLAEAPTFAKYGWSHALTLAHASRDLLRLGADPVRCTRNALLYVLASRHTMARIPLPAAAPPHAGDGPLAAQLEETGGGGLAAGPRRRRVARARGRACGLAHPRERRRGAQRRAPRQAHPLRPGDGPRGPRGRTALPGGRREARGGVGARAARRGAPRPPGGSRVARAAGLRRPTCPSGAGRAPARRHPSRGGSPGRPRATLRLRVVSAARAAGRRGGARRLRGLGAHRRGALRRPPPAPTAAAEPVRRLGGRHGGHRGLPAAPYYLLLVGTRGELAPSVSSRFEESPGFMAAPGLAGSPPS